MDDQRVATDPGMQAMPVERRGEHAADLRQQMSLLIKHPGQVRWPAAAGQECRYFTGLEGFMFHFEAGNTAGNRVNRR